MAQAKHRTSATALRGSWLSSLLLGVLLLLLLVLLLALVLSASVSEARATEPSPQRVELSNNLLSVDVHDMPLDALLAEIAQVTGLQLQQDIGLDQHISLHLRDQPLHRLVARVLEGHSFVLYFRKQLPLTTRGGHLRVFGDGVAASAREIALDRLRVQLWQSDLQSRLEAIETLQMLDAQGDARAAQLMQHALYSADAELRASAIDAIADGAAHAGNNRAAKALATALDDRDPDLREQAVYALGEIGGEVAKRLLQRARSDRADIVSEAAAEMLDEWAIAESR